MKERNFLASHLILFVQKHNYPLAIRIIIPKYHTSFFKNKIWDQHAR